MESPDSTSEHEVKSKETGKYLLNKRSSIRYIVHEFSIGEIGVVREISRGGMIINKSTTAEIIGPRVNVSRLNHEISMDISWQNEDIIALKFIDNFNSAELIKSLTKRIKEQEYHQDRVISNGTIMAVSQTDILGPCLNLIEELENPDADVTKLTAYVEEISEASGEPDDHGDNDDEEENKTSPHNTEPGDLKDLIIFVANTALTKSDDKIDDLDYAIVRLGLESVKKISKDYLRRKMPEREVSLSGFNNYEAFNILKTSMFKHLASFFGYEDVDGEGSLLLALDTKGIDVMMSHEKRGPGKLKNYYISSPRLYSEISRVYEKNMFGKDLLMINKHYFNQKLDMFQDIYDGYILGHLILNPCYMFDHKIKLDVTRKKLVYAFLVSVSIMATEFIMDGDKASGAGLVHILKRSGMNEDKIMLFLNESIERSNIILKDLGLGGKIKNRPLPKSSFKIGDYLKKDVHSKYLIQSFENFSTMKSIRRMALRYEDTAYAHFILTKMLNADDIGLTSSAYCVVPCMNISVHELYLEDYAFFDLIIFKDIDRLPETHMKEFVKLWHSFEGKIIATFNNYSFLDLDHEELYVLMKDHIVDFPSYYGDSRIHETMIDHTVQYIEPFIGAREIDKSSYSNQIVSMSYIKDMELRTL